jgi:hypothetical protein
MVDLSGRKAARLNVPIGTANQSVAMDYMVLLGEKEMGI